MDSGCFGGGWVCGWVVDGLWLVGAWWCWCVDTGYMGGPLIGDGQLVDCGWLVGSVLVKNTFWEN